MKFCFIKLIIFTFIYFKSIESKDDCRTKSCGYKNPWIAIVNLFIKETPFRNILNHPQFKVVINKMMNDKLLEKIEKFIKSEYWCVVSNLKLL